MIFSIPLRSQNTRQNHIQLHNVKTTSYSKTLIYYPFVIILIQVSFINFSSEGTCRARGFFVK